MSKLSGRARFVAPAWALLLLVSGASANLPRDAAFEKFWSSRDPDAASKAAQDIVKAGVGFDEAFTRLRGGRPYAKDVQTGVVRLNRRSAVADFPYTLDVPAAYDPGRRYQVRIQLHGGVMMRQDASSRGHSVIGALDGDEQIYVYPTSWRDAPWWSDIQIDNLEAILDSVKRTYNVDENRVVLAGVSDGATAAYYFAMRDTTPYASFLPLNGYPLVLRSAHLDIDGDFHPNNLLDKPLFIVNGGRDPLYPASSMDRYVDHMKRCGIDVVYEPQADAGHETRWWPAVKESFEAFVRARPRKPLPDTLTWETDRSDRYNRAHWLVIDKLGPGSNDVREMTDVNEFTSATEPPGQPAPLLFARHHRSGRVDLMRDGNTVIARTRGVAAFTLLLSPDAFDFSKPVKIVANDRVSFDGPVEKSLAVLLKWAARDNDRTMLFGAELHVTP